MKKILLFICLFSSTLILNAQKNVEFTKENFPDKKKELKSLLKEIDYAVNEPEFGFNTFDSIIFSIHIPTFEKAFDFNPNNALNNFRLGTCYIYNGKLKQGLNLLEKAYAVKPNAHLMLPFYLGKAYHFNEEYSKAIKLFDEFRTLAQKEEKVSWGVLATKCIQECKNGEKYSKKPLRVWIDNLGPSINSKYPEYTSYISTDQSRIIYVARRNTTTGGIIHPSDNMYMEDIMISEKVDGEWSVAKEMSKPVNTESHDAPAGLSADGNTMFVYKGDEGLGDIYISKHSEGSWSKPEPIKEINEKDSRESSACLSYDGKILYFVSDRKGGYGKEDIWYTTWDEKKERWGDPVNMGATINTKHMERGVFMHPDGVTMYFSSNGHDNMGGLDIFSSTRSGEVWGKPENIGYPINTPLNDVFFVLAANGRHAYYTSSRSDSYGDKDIYKITFRGEKLEPLINTEDNLIASNTSAIKDKTIEPELNIKTTRLAVLKGIIRDEKTKDPLGADIDLVDNESDKIIATFKSDGTTGKYLISLPAGKNYGVAVKKDKFLFHSENVNIPDLTGYREYEKDIDLKRLEVGKTIVLRNIFYDLNKYNLRPESQSELDRLIKLMNDNPTLKIELSSHTDTRGSDSYNQKLSENRAKSVVDYLIEHQISKDRLVYKGYGETKLMITDAEISKLNGTEAKEEAHQQNRRTEFKVLSI